MNPSAVICFVLVVVVAAAVALLAPGQPMAPALCPRPVVVQGNTVSCSGALAADPTSPPVPAAANARR